MPKIKIKAGSITNLTDARYFAAMMVDYMGFCLDFSHDERISPEEFHGIKAWVEGPEIVAEVGKTPKSLLQEVYSQEDYQWVSCHLDNTSFEGDQNIIEVQVDSIQDLAHLDFKSSKIYQLHLDQIVEEDLYQGVLLTELCTQHKVFVPAPNHEHNIRRLIEDIKPYGIHVKGGTEEKVGFKSYEELDFFFEQMEIYA